MNNLKDNKQILQQLKPLVENKKLLDSFNNYIDLVIDKQHLVMEQTDNNIMMYRSQGAISALRRLKYLRQEVLGDIR
jgi:hypothetical protein